MASYIISAADELQAVSRYIVGPDDTLLPVVGAGGTPPDPPDPPSFPILPGIVYDQARLDSINISINPWLAGHNKLSTSGGRTTVSTPYARGFKRYNALNYDDPYTPGTTIPSDYDGNGAQAMHRDDGLAAIAQAVEGYAKRLTNPSESATHYSNARTILTAYKDVTTFVTDARANHKLFPMWGGNGFLAALALVGDFPARASLIDKLNTTYLNVADHVQGGNWHGSMAKFRIGLATIRGDSSALDDACDYFRSRFESFCWITSDGATVNQLIDANGTPASSVIYSQHWYSSVPSNRSSAGLVNGWTCEHNRDYGHMAMGLNDFLDAAITATIQGVDLLTEYEERFKACLEFEAGSINDAIDVTGVANGSTYTAPAYPRAGGGYGWADGGWLQALSIWGEGDLPQVAELVDRGSIVQQPGSANGQWFKGLTFPLGS